VDVDRIVQQLMEQEPKGPVTANPGQMKLAARQREGRTDATDIFNYGPDWDSYWENANTNVQDMFKPENFINTMAGVGPGIIRNPKSGKILTPQEAIPQATENINAFLNLRPDAASPMGTKATDILQQGVKASDDDINWALGLARPTKVAPVNISDPLILAREHSKLDVSEGAKERVNQIANAISTGYDFSKPLKISNPDSGKYTYLNSKEEAQELLNSARDMLTKNFPDLKDFANKFGKFE